MPDAPVLLSKPSTIPEAKCRLSGLDGLRALAIVTVLLNHFLQNLVPTNSFERTLLAPFQGGWGIAAFLTLSGFLVGSSLYKHEQLTFKDARLFLARRALRVLPLYYAILAVTLLLLPWLWPHLAASQSTLYANQRYLWSLSSNLAIALHGQWFFYGDTVNLVHLWTVSLQEQFVVLAVLTAWLLPQRWLPRLMLLMIVAAPIVRLVMHYQGYSPLSLYTFTFARTDSFFAGAALAWAWRRGANLQPWKMPAMLLLTAGTVLWIILACLQLHHWNGTIMATLGYSLQAAMIVAFLLVLLVKPRSRVTRFLDNRLFAFVARYSFGMFCLHMLVFPPVEHLLQPLAPATPHALFAFGWLLAGVSVVASLLASAVCYHAFEQPLLEVKETLSLGRSALTSTRRWTLALQPAACLAAICLILAVASRLASGR